MRARWILVASAVQVAALSTSADELVVTTWRGEAATAVVRKAVPASNDAGDEVARGTLPLKADLPTGSYQVAVTAGDTTTTFPIKLAGAPLRLELDLAPPEGFRFVPAGAFVYANGYDGPRLMRPTDPVTMHTDAYYVATLEITNCQYAAFLAAIANPLERRRYVPRVFFDHNLAQKGERIPDEYLWPGGELPEPIAQHPVRGIGCEDAIAYASWAGLRLASEPEWEKAARGVDGRQYPWGDLEAPTDELRRDYHAVGLHPFDRSPYGALDVASGVHEWTYTPGRAELAAVKGGSFEHAANEKKFLTCGWRMAMPIGAEPTGTDKGMRVFASALAPGADLAAAIASPDYGVRLVALARRAEAAGSTEAELVPLLADPEAQVRAAAARCLLRRGAPGRTALLGAIEQGTPSGGEALDAVWRAAAFEDPMREELTALWLRLSERGQTTLGEELFARAARDCSADWPMRRYVGIRAHGLIRPRFEAAVARGELLLAARFVTDVEGDNLRLANAWAGFKSFEHVLRAYRRAGKAPAPEDLSRWYEQSTRGSLDRAMLQAARGEHEAAAKRFRKLAEGRVKNVAFHLELARSLIALGKPDEAREALRQADRVEPFSVEASMLRESLSSGK